MLVSINMILKVCLSGEKKCFAFVSCTESISIILVIFWFILIYITGRFEFNIFGERIYNLILQGFINYSNKYIFVLDSVILLFYYLLYMIQSINRDNMLRNISLFLLIFIFNICADYFIYITYRLLMFA